MVKRTHKPSAKTEKPTTVASTSGDANASERSRPSYARSRLLREIKSLGGDATDLDLLEDVLSGSEREDNGDDERNRGDTKGGRKSKETALDEKELMGELQSFLMKSLGLDPAKSQVDVVPDDDGDDDSDGDTGDKAEETGNQTSQVPAIAPVQATTTNDDKKGKLGKNDMDAVQKMVHDIISGGGDGDAAPSAGGPAATPRVRLLVEPEPHWWRVSLPKINANHRTEAASDHNAIAQKYQAAKLLWEEEAARYERAKLSSSASADKDIISTILKSGTTSDKISALTLMIQESPLHQFALLRDHLIHGMARKKARREALQAIDSVKDLMLSTILPDRKLCYFVDQPVMAPGVTTQHLIVWYFEDALKKLYFEFIQLMEELARDTLLFVKNKMLACIFELLATKPEEEQNLLTLLSNKLGDLDRKIASKSAHLLSQLLIRHPAMKLVVAKEVERLVFRTNISERAQYYAITFLNQVILTHREEDANAAAYLIDIYFRVFESLVRRIRQAPSSGAKERGKHGKHGKDKKRHRNKGKPTTASSSAAADGKPEGTMTKVDGIDAKMMAALLTGVNRAFPYAKIDDDTFERHMDTLFTITHIGTFNIIIQALMLIFQVQHSREMVSDRFYRALYDTMIDRRLHEASKQAMYLNLLYKALYADSSIVRVRAFVKRLVQVCGQAQVPLACGSLYLIGEVARRKPGLWALVTQAEEDDSEEHFVDAMDEDAAVGVAVAGVAADAEGVAPQATVSETKKNTDVVRTNKYDGRRRDPLYANADQTCLWELCLFAMHFHPTVSMYARTLLSGHPIDAPPGAKNYDPLQNHTLSRFLDRFVYKTPKKVVSLHQGASLMQPRVQQPAGSIHILAGGHRKRQVVLHEPGVDTMPLSMDDQPIHLVKWDERDEGSVAPDEAFFYRFFKTRGSVRVRSQALAQDDMGLIGHDEDDDDDEDDDGIDEDDGIDDDGVDANDVDEDASEIGDDEAWEVMRKSAGFPAGGDGEDMGDDDDDDDDDDLEPLQMDDSDEDEANGDMTVEEQVEFEEEEADDSVNGSDAGDIDGVGEGSDGDDEMDAWAQGGKDATKGQEVSKDDDSDASVEEDEEGDAEIANALLADEKEEEDDDDDDDEDDVSNTKTKTKRGSTRDRMELKARKFGYKGDFFASTKGVGDFASADDFAQLMDMQDDGDDDDGQDEDGGVEVGGRKRKRSFDRGDGKRRRKGRKRVSGNKK